MNQFERQPQPEPLHTPEQAEKPPFLYYASPKGDKLEIEPTRKYRQAPASERQDKAIRASENIAYAAARTLIQYTQQEKFLSYQLSEEGKMQLVVAMHHTQAKALENPVFIYKLSSDSFIPGPVTEGGLQTYESKEAVSPTEEPVKYNSIREAIEHHGGVIQIEKKEEWRADRGFDLPPENSEMEKQQLEQLRAQEEQVKQAKREERQGSPKNEKKIPAGSEPTPSQIETLASFGIEEPPSKLMASRMIDFILHGNGATHVPDNKFERAGFLRKAQKRWDGQRVTKIRTEEKGTVVYIFPRRTAEIKAIRDSENRSTEVINPFNATVLWDGAQRNKVEYLSYLKLEEKEEEQQ